MRINGRVVAIGAAGVVALAAGGAGIAQAVSGGEDNVSGAAAKKAGDAALAAVGEGTVGEVERADEDGTGAYEVEVRLADGSEVEVYVDAGFHVLGSSSDDDGKAEDSDEGEAGADD
jgi:uncharacterized membrane protein YkoI